MSLNKPSSEYFIGILQVFFTSEHFIILIFYVLSFCSYCNFSNVKDYTEQEFTKGHKMQKQIITRISEESIKYKIVVYGWANAKVNSTLLHNHNNYGYLCAEQQSNVKIQNFAHVHFRRVVKTIFVHVFLICLSFSQPELCYVNVCNPVSIHKKRSSLTEVHRSVSTDNYYA